MTDYEKKIILISSSSGKDILQMLKEKSINLKLMDDYFSSLLTCNFNDKKDFFLEKLNFVHKYYKGYKERPHIYLWLNAIKYNQLDFLIENDFIPHMNSNILLNYLKYSFEKYHPDEAPVYESEINKILFLLKSNKKIKNISKEFEKFPVNIYYKGLISNEAVDFLENFYIQYEQRTPYKFRYYCLVSQIKFLDSSSNITENDYLIKSILSYQIDKLLSNFPFSIEKINSIKPANKNHKIIIDTFVKAFCLKNHLSNELKSDKSMPKPIKI